MFSNKHFCVGFVKDVLFQLYSYKVKMVSVSKGQLKEVEELTVWIVALTASGSFSYSANCLIYPHECDVDISKVSLELIVWM